MRIINSDLEKIAAIPSQYPSDSMPEIALAGRSNVGKSSFINSMVNKKNLARTSSKPGKTRTVNFYNIDDKFRLVDLPGYGYAKVSKGEKDNWAKIIETYLNNRKNLYEVFLLVDIRHEPTNQDLEMYKWIISFGFTGFVIATKADKISRNKVNKNINIIAKKLNISDKDLIFPYSAESKLNKDILLEQLSAIIKFGSGFED